MGWIQVGTRTGTACDELWDGASSDLGAHQNGVSRRTALASDTQEGSVRLISVR